MAGTKDFDWAVPILKEVFPSTEIELQEINYGHDVHALITWLAEDMVTALQLRQGYHPTRGGMWLVAYDVNALPDKEAKLRETAQFMANKFAEAEA